MKVILTINGRKPQFFQEMSEARVKTSKLGKRGWSIKPYKYPGKGNLCMYASN